jgi:hypothetical protein
MCAASPAKQDPLRRRGYFSAIMALISPPGAFDPRLRYSGSQEIHARAKSGASELTQNAGDNGICTCHATYADRMISTRQMNG